MGTLGKKYAQLTGRFQISLDPSMLAALNTRSALTNRSIASLIREAIGNYLRDVPATPQVPDWEREQRP